MRHTKPFLIAIAALVVCDGLDVLSSLLCIGVPGVFETNPFARTASGAFYWQHGIAIKLMLEATYLCMGMAFIYSAKGLRRWNASLPALIAAIPVWVASFTLMSVAVIQNFLYAAGWYTDLASKKPSILDLFK